MRFDISSLRGTENNDGGKRKKLWPLPPVINLLVLLVLMITVIAVSINTKTPQISAEKPESTASEIPTGAEPTTEPTATPEATVTATPTTSPTKKPAKDDVVVVERAPTATPVATAAPTKNVKGAATESLGGVLVVDDSAYEFYNFNQEVADSYINLINTAATSLKTEAGATLYEMIVPTSLGVLLPEDFVESMNCSSESKALEYFYGSFNTDVKPVKVLDILKANADKYIFFRTDHHWTNLGAYYAYTVAMEAAGLHPLDISKYKKEEYSPYLGSFYEQSENSPALGNNPDTCEAYIPPDTVVMNVTQADGQVLEDWPMIADGTDYGTSEKYIIFIGGDNPYTEITNEKAESNKSCIIVKESFGNALAPFFVSNYKNVYVIDYRHYSGRIQDLAKEKGATDVFICNNMSATRSEYLVEQLGTVF